MIDVELRDLKKINIGFIGAGSHAKKLISVFQSYPNTFVSKVYKPNMLDKNARDTDQIDDLIDCDAIVIASPNNTHHHYLDWASANFKGYVFCEKPPVNNLRGLISFEKLNFQKSFFGFNLRFSDFNILSKKYFSSGELGELMHFSASVGYGFAYKSSYANSWKSCATRSPLGVIENLAIHYLDLAVCLFGNITSISVKKMNFAKSGGVPDTANIQAVHQDGKTSSIMVSYSTPLINNLNLIASNGIVSIDDSVLTIRSPRDVFDQNGLFIKPPIIDEVKYHGDEFFETSIMRQIEYFLNVVASKGTFERSEFDQSQHICNVLLNS